MHGPAQAAMLQDAWFRSPFRFAGRIASAGFAERRTLNPVT